MRKWGSQPFSETVIRFSSGPTYKINEIRMAVTETAARFCVPEVNIPHLQVKKPEHTKTLNERHKQTEQQSIYRWVYCVPSGILYVN